MKIAYLVLAHTDPEFLGRLTRRLTHNTEDGVFIHIDAKASREPFIEAVGQNEQVHFVEHPVRVYWGGYSSVQATLMLLEAAIAKKKYQRFVILQGQDYPICSNQEIHAFFEHHPKTEFIRAVNETRTGIATDLWKYCRYHFQDQPLLHTVQAAARYITIALARRGILLKLKPPYIPISGKSLDIYRGWAHIALTEDAVCYILQFHQHTPAYRKYFRYSYACDESYFHTIIYNSDFVKNTVDGAATTDRSLKGMLNLTYFEYPVKVTIFTKKQDFGTLAASGCLFFRKANSSSGELLDYIDEISDNTDV